VSYRIFPISETAVTIDFGNEISLELNEKVLCLAEFIQNNKFIGFAELIPAYSSLTCFFDLWDVKQNYSDFPTAFSFVKSFLEKGLTQLNRTIKSKQRTFAIPVDYGEKYGLDLELIGRNAKLSKDEVIKIHSEKTYRVFMIGFLPGFAYMGEVDERIATPRRDSPRTNVAKGSVGIAGKQTGVYPLESPGGWQIIGRTNVEMFTPNAENPSLLQTGDLVTFYPI
jgi:inhibitor of KinA